MDRRDVLRVSALALGGSISSSCTRAILSDGNLSRSPQRTLFSDTDMAKVARLAELIIPGTDTPGAIEAGVPEFIHVIVADWYTDDERRIFMDGLLAIDDFAEERFSVAFIAATAGQQTDALQHFESEVEDDENIAAGGAGQSSFFTKLKELTVLGYYTSEIGANQELTYLPVPGRYDGDALFDDLGRQWKS